MAEILKAIIFGIVEGITEWLPISSTGHMILLNEFLTLDVSAEFLGYVSGSDPAGSDFGGRGAVLESDLTVCAQFLGSSRCCGSE